MDALLYRSPGRFDVTGADEPRPGADEVLVRVRACGLCHTDIDVLHGRYGDGTYPLVPGHEFAGTVEAVGEKATSVAVGDRVVVDPNLSCGECRACRRGLANLCERLGAYGVTVNGGFAELVAVRADHAYPIGELGFDVAALAEPLGCVLNGIDAMELAGARDALVFGAGPIGLLMGLALRDAGVDDVAVVDLAEPRLAFAESLGLRPLASGSDALASHRRSFDVVVDATGVVAVAQGLIDYAANGASVLLFGVCPPDARIEISPFEVFRRQIRIAGAHSLNHNVAQAMDVLRRSGDTMGRLVSHRLPLAQIAPFLGHDRPADAMKVQFTTD